MPGVMEQLHDDHRNVARLLDFLAESVVRAEAGGPLDLDLLHDVMFYMTHYPDIFHHPREDLVFERLLVRDPQTRVPVRTLLEEHTTILDNGEAFLKVIKTVRQAGGSSSSSLLVMARSYTDAMRTHMDKEEGEVFPLAKLLLTSSDWSGIEATLAARADPLFGQVVEDKYRSLAQKIEGLK